MSERERTHSENYMIRTFKLWQCGACSRWFFPGCYVFGCPHCDKAPPKVKPSAPRPLVKRAAPTPPPATTNANNTPRPLLRRTR
jgi:hypothetical protein